MDKITVAKMGTDNFKNLFKEGKDRKGSGSQALGWVPAAPIGPSQAELQKCGVSAEVLKLVEI